MKTVGNIILKIIILSAFLPANFMLYFAVAIGWNIFRDGHFLVSLNCIIGIGGYAGLLLSLILPAAKKLVLKIILLCCGLLSSQIYWVGGGLSWDVFNPFSDPGQWRLIGWPNCAAFGLILYFGCKLFLEKRYHKNIK